MPIPASDISEYMRDSGSATPQPNLSRVDGQSGGHTAIGAGVNIGAGVTREKTEAELEADRLYEERMEDGYVKREGGA
ncbi:hypothetical protein DL764_008589 [Monosporascus ibericus]|uniref:Uncharacterized protein n=1 Tax=Monosporascus ibericus TaxID=155417 RepID=A0A4Q4SZW8_9PEZI|nr:hypothetical protein DL764_008589 [Monosporascus ibericus]